VDWEADRRRHGGEVGLPVDPGWRGGIVRFLGLAAEMAATLDAVALADDHLELDAVLVLQEARHD